MDDNSDELVVVEAPKKKGRPLQDFKIRDTKTETVKINGKKVEIIRFIGE